VDGELSGGGVLPGPYVLTGPDETVWFLLGGEDGAPLDLVWRGAQLTVVSPTGAVTDLTVGPGDLDAASTSWVVDVPGTWRFDFDSAGCDAGVVVERR